MDRLRRPPEQARERPRARVAAGRAAIDVDLAARERLGVGPAAAEAALAALGLRQDLLDALDAQAAAAARALTPGSSRSTP
jgi:hypothetical protein